MDTKIKLPVPSVDAARKLQIITELTESRVFVNLYNLYNLYNHVSDVSIEYHRILTKNGM